MAAQAVEPEFLGLAEFVFQKFGRWGGTDRIRVVVRRSSFLRSLTSDQRFGSTIADRHFEIWNEPNGKPFWRGSYDPDYFSLYRATSEAVVEAGYSIKLGGPAIVYRAGTGQLRRDMEQFLRFLSDNPGVKCDFISLHAKGSWSLEQEPEFDTSFDAMIETAETTLAVNAVRFAGLPIVNDEADMRVGFNIPYIAAYGSPVFSIAVQSDDRVCLPEFTNFSPRQRRQHAHNRRIIDLSSV